MQGLAFAGGRGRFRGSARLGYAAVDDGEGPSPLTLHGRTYSFRIFLF